MSVRIVTDSTSDIPPEQASAAGITVVPLTVFFGDDAASEQQRIGIISDDRQTSAAAAALDGLSGVMCGSDPSAQRCADANSCRQMEHSG